MTVAKNDHEFSTDDMTQNRGKLTTDAIAGAGKHETEAELVDEHASGMHARREVSGASLEPLFAENVDHDFRDRWREIQTGFVDEPRHAVEQADGLVAELMQRLAQSFSEQRNNLEHQWDASDKVSTEELRVALTRYRSFFERLLSV